MKAVNPVTLERSLLGHYALNITKHNQRKPLHNPQIVITSPSLQTTYFVRMHQGNSCQHHYFQHDVGQGRQGQRAVLTKGWPHSFIFVYSDSFHDIQVTFSIPDVFFLLCCQSFLPSALTMFKLRKCFAGHKETVCCVSAAGHSYGLRPSPYKHVLYYVKIHTERHVYGEGPPGFMLAFGRT